MKVSMLKTQDVFSKLFTIKDDVLAAIKENMEEFGYDEAQPIVVWQGKNIVVDGHTRLRVAKDLGVEDVPVVERFFRDELDALEYAIHNQRDRRNIEPEELLRCILAVDQRRQRGGDHGNQYTGGKVAKGSHDTIGSSAQETAKIVGVSDATVKRARTVLSDGDATQAVLSGEKSISRAAQEVKEKKAEQKEASVSQSTFNKTNDNIEWAQWTWNPVTGCKHGCPYCYARDIAERFYPQKFEPTFHENRLNAPFNTKQPKNPTIGEKNVFVCSMADLFGDWVPQEWIDRVLDVCRKTPQWNYLFLTKNPKRYIGIDWPDNAWVGITADTHKRFQEACEIFYQIDASVKFVSCEPLREPVAHIKATTEGATTYLCDPYAELDMTSPDWIIIGGQSKTTGAPAMQPEWGWVEELLIYAHIKGCQVYFKPNLTVRPKEYPED